MPAFVVKQLVEILLRSIVYSTPAFVGLVLVLVGTVELLRNNVPNIYIADAKGRIRSVEPVPGQDGRYLVVLDFVCVGFQPQNSTAARTMGPTTRPKYPTLLSPGSGSPLCDEGTRIDASLPKAGDEWSQKVLYDPADPTVNSVGRRPLPNLKVYGTLTLVGLVLAVVLWPRAR